MPFQMNVSLFKIQWNFPPSPPFSLPPPSLFLSPRDVKNNWHFCNWRYFQVEKKLVNDTRSLYQKHSINAKRINSSYKWNNQNKIVIQSKEREKVISIKLKNHHLIAYKFYTNRSKIQCNTTIYGWSMNAIIKIKQI